MKEFSDKIKRINWLFFCVFLIIGNYGFAQSFVVWNDGGVAPNLSGLTSITGTYPGGTVVVTNTGSGQEISYGAEFGVANLNGATAAEVFATYGATNNPPSKSMTYTFSTPVLINSFNIHDIDYGPTWNDDMHFSGVTFTSVTTGGGLVANTTGTVGAAADIGSFSEYANWFTSTNAITSFTIDFQVTSGKTHAYLGYSLEITPILSVDIFGDTLVCVGDSIDLVAINDSIYSWSTTDDMSNVFSTDSTVTVSPAVTTTYMLVGTTDTTYHTVHVVQPVGTTYLGVDSTICEGEQVILNGTTANATNYVWQDGSTDSLFTVTQTGVYWVEASNYCGTSRDTIVINVTPLVSPFNLGNDVTLCPGDSLLLTITTNNATSYLWQDGDTTSYYLVTQAGTYWAQANNSCSSESDSVIIDYIPEPLLEPFNSVVICDDETYLIDATTPGANYYWNNDSTYSSQTVSEQGTYWVEINNSSCISIHEIVVDVVDCESVLIMPNVFSPNNDGVNDLFYPFYRNNVTIQKVIILNRWGNVVYEGQDLIPGWDGTTNGNKCVEGVYFWKVEYLDFEDNPLSQHGFVQLVID